MDYPVTQGTEGLKHALLRLCEESAAAANQGFQVLVLSDREAGPANLPVRCDLHSCYFK